MRRLRAWLARAGDLFARTRRDRNLSDEIETHLQLHVDDNLRAGMAPPEARRQALLSLGGVDQTKEHYRDQRGFPFIEHVIQDIRYAVRVLRRSPGFTIAAVLTLALGIGANAAIFSIADATAFRPPDVPRPGELVRVFSSSKAVPYDRLSYPDYLDFRQHITTLSSVVAYENEFIPLARSDGDLPQLFGGWAVSGNFFSALGVEPTLGRGFGSDEERASGASPVAVISHALWTRHFAADPNIVGRHVALAGHDFTIVGVAPNGFAGTELYFHPDLFVPLTMIRQVASGAAANVLEDRTQRWLTVLGRVARTSSVAAASAEAAALAQSLAQAYPDVDGGRTAVVFPEVTARAKLDSGGYDGAIILLAVVGIVLLLACANIANLLLSRGAGRAREIAVRLALGASRGRVCRQLLTESLVLAFAGAALGLFLASWILAYFSSIKLAADLPLRLDIRIDQRMLLVTFTAAIGSALLSGLAPAFRSTRLNLMTSLKASMTTVDAGFKRLTLRNALVVAQVAGSVVLLTTAGLVGQGFMTALNTDPGFERDRVLLVAFGPGMVGYDQTKARRFYTDVVERTKAIPGVEAAGLTEFVPLSENSGSTTLVVDGYEMPPDQDRLAVGSTIVDSGYWTAMGVSVVRGRAFDAHDIASSPRVAVINETMARRYWPNEDALGKSFRLRDRSGPSVQVIGIARDGKYVEVREAPQPFVFLPFSQRYRSSMTMTVLARGDAASLTAPVRDAVRSVDSNVPMYDVRTMQDVYYSHAMLPPRLSFQIMSALGLLGLALSVIGLYGVIAYVTATRTREIGIRMAIGADRFSVLLLVLRQASVIVVVGIVIGCLLAFIATPQMSQAFDTEPRNAAIAAIAVAVVAAVSALAALIPARRAASVNPTIALRSE